MRRYHSTGSRLSDIEPLPFVPCARALPALAGVVAAEVVRRVVCSHSACPAF